MFRINSSGATSDGHFKESPAPATRLSAAWLNTLQEEFAGVIEHAGMTLDPGNDAQLLAALLVVIGQAFSLTVDSDGFMLKLATAAGTVKLETGKARGTVTTEITQAIAFRAPFANTGYRVFLQDVILNANNKQDLYLQTIDSSRTTGGLTVQYQSDDGNDMGSYGFDWMAIGLAA